MNRLTEDAVTQGSTQVVDFDYSYDKAGNRTTQVINGTQTTFTYNAANQLTATSQGTTYSYDANGNETHISTGNVSLVYNAKDQTTSIKGVSMNYTGTDQNQRVKAGGASYVNSPLGISSQSDSSGTTSFTRDNQGNLVSERTPAGTYYYLFNGLGSIVGLTKNSGDLAGNERYQYDAYGNLNSAPVNGLLLANPWRFAGGYYDSATGLTKFGVRYDDTTTGRWTQQDPIAGSLFNPTSSNRYVYAGDDPVNMVDPGGRCAGRQGVVLGAFGTSSVFLNECTVQEIEGALWMGTGVSAIVALMSAGTNIPADFLAGLGAIGAGALQMIDGAGGNVGIIAYFTLTGFSGAVPQ